MPYLVKILTYEDGQTVENPQWCAVINVDSRRALCSGQVFGKGEGNATYKEKGTGKVTCKNCIEIIDGLKKYKLSK